MRFAIDNKVCKLASALQGPQATPRDGIRRDYEPGLARAQLKNVVAEEARAAAATGTRRRSGR